ncbi:MAG: tetratricopeptide repeat protein [Spirochaetaceae bacterium]|nr:tetratricopeptide repeat protein [Spirochaetaceae bacterium]MDT8298962.1 tetratricopeptide repeat protein [Spirochaetaceae bacterium]
MAKDMKRPTWMGILGFLLLTISCQNSTPSTRVLAGNLSYGRGQYQKAILQYLWADDEIRVGKDVIYYNLANVYFALGEGDAALRSWSMAESNTDDADILFRIAFNRGVLYYHRGRYDESYRAFRNALTIRPSDIDAKINLEDSLSRIRSAVPQNNLAGEDRSTEGDEDSQRLLDYVKRKEADSWLSQRDDDVVYTEDW